MSEQLPAAARSRWPLIVAIAILATVVVVAAIPIAVSLLRERDAGPARVAARDKGAEALVVQNVEGVEGTNLVAITIGYGYRAGDPYASSGTPQLRNVVLLDRTSGANRRLLADNLRRITNLTFLPAEAEKQPAPADPADGKPVPPPPPSAYYVVQLRQAEGKREDVLIGNIASGAQAFLLRNVDGIDRMWMIAPTRLAVLLREGMQLQYRVIDVPALKLVASQPVEIG